MSCSSDLSWNSVAGKTSKKMDAGLAERVGSAEAGSEMSGVQPQLDTTLRRGGALGDAGREARLVAAGGVAVDQAL